MMEETLIHYGGAVKAIPGTGMIEGLLIPFGAEDDLDHDGEFFSARTDLGLRLPAAVKLHYHHGMNAKVGTTPLAWAQLEQRPDGVWFKADLSEDMDWLEEEREKAQRYRAHTLKLAQEGLLGASSGAASHLVVKQPAGKGQWIARWPTAEASVTPTPANPRTVGTVNLKALLEVPDPEEALKARRNDLAQDPPCAPDAARCPGTRQTLAEHSCAVVSAVTEYVERVEDRAAFRLATETKAGRVLSGANVTELESVLEMLNQVGEIRARVVALLEKARPASSESEGEETEKKTADNSQRGTTPLLFDTLRQETNRLAAQAGAHS